MKYLMRQFIGQDNFLLTNFRYAWRQKSVTRRLFEVKNENLAEMILKEYNPAVINEQMFNMLLKEEG